LLIVIIVIKFTALYVVSLDKTATFNLDRFCNCIKYAVATTETVCTVDDLS